MRTHNDPSSRGRSDRRSTPPPISANCGPREQVPLLMTLHPVDSSARHTDDVISFGWTRPDAVSTESAQWARTPGHAWDTASTLLAA